MTYDDAVATLFRAPHDEFIAERKRLAAALKAGGEKAGATKLGKLPRPPISAWVVNQLWWHARAPFDAMLETGEQLRAGKLKAMAAHREAIATLRARAQTILKDAGNAATESTLRRVTTTLAAIAATGGFDPDQPGMLTADRDPPGFEAVGIAALSEPKQVDDDDEVDRDVEPADEPGDELEVRRTAKQSAAAAKRAAEEAAERDRAEAAAARRKSEQDRARRAAERHRIEAALRTAVGDVERREREVARLGEALAEAEVAVEKARAIANDLESQLASLTAVN